MTLMELKTKVADLQALVKLNSIWIANLASQQQTNVNDIAEIRLLMARLEKKLTHINPRPDPVEFSSEGGEVLSSNNVVASTDMECGLMEESAVTTPITDLVVVVQHKDMVRCSTDQIAMEVVSTESTLVSTYQDTTRTELSAVKEDVINLVEVPIAWFDRVIHSNSASLLQICSGGISHNRFVFMGIQPIYIAPTIEGITLFGGTKIGFVVLSSHQDTHCSVTGIEWYIITGGNELMVQHKWSVSVCFMKHRGFFQWCFKGGTLHLSSNVYHSSYLILNVTTLPYEDTQFACEIMSAEFICDGYESICGSKVLEMLGYVARYGSGYKQFQECKVMSRVAVAKVCYENSFDESALCDMKHSDLGQGFFKGGIMQGSQGIPTIGLYIFSDHVGCSLFEWNPGIDRGTVNSINNGKRKSNPYNTKYEQYEASWVENTKPVIEMGHKAIVGNNMVCLQIGIAKVDSAVGSWSWIPQFESGLGFEPEVLGYQHVYDLGHLITSWYPEPSFICSKRSYKKLESGEYRQQRLSATQQRVPAHGSQIYSVDGVPRESSVLEIFYFLLTDIFKDSLLVLLCHFCVTSSFGSAQLGGAQTGYILFYQVFIVWDHILAQFCWCYALYSLQEGDNWDFCMTKRMYYGLQGLNTSGCSMGGNTRKTIVTQLLILEDGNNSIAQVNDLTLLWMVIWMMASLTLSHGGEHLTCGRMWFFLSKLFDIVVGCWVIVDPRPAKIRSLKLVPDVKSQQELLNISALAHPFDPNISHIWRSRGYLLPRSWCIAKGFLLHVLKFLRVEVWLLCESFYSDIVDIICQVTSFEVLTILCHHLFGLSITTDSFSPGQPDISVVDYSYAMDGRMQKTRTVAISRACKIPACAALDWCSLFNNFITTLVILDVHNPAKRANNVAYQLQIIACISSIPVLPMITLIKPSRGSERTDGLHVSAILVYALDNNGVKHRVLEHGPCSAWIVVDSGLIWLSAAFGDSMSWYGYTMSSHGEQVQCALAVTDLLEFIWHIAWCFACIHGSLRRHIAFFSPLFGELCYATSFALKNYLETQASSAFIIEPDPLTQDLVRASRTEIRGPIFTNCGSILSHIMTIWVLQGGKFEQDISSGSIWSCSAAFSLLFNVVIKKCFKYRCVYVGVHLLNFLWRIAWM